MDEMEHAASVRVRRGARWLDENFPGWQSRINPKTLNLSNPNTCICGQVFRDSFLYLGNGSPNGFHYAYSNLFGEANAWVAKLIPKSDPNRRFSVSTALGFDCGSRPGGPTRSDRINVNCAALQDVWLELLAPPK